MGEGIANDRIDLAAISIDPDRRTRRFGPQMVSDNFEDNREFPWRREVARFNLDSYINPYPLDFAVTVTISEIDYGAGFADALNQMRGAIREGIVKLLGEIGKILGSLVAAGEVGKFIGEILGQLIALGIGELLNIISRAVQDDVFEPRVAAIRLDSKYSTFSGVLDKVPGPFRSPEQEFKFEGFGGAYRVYIIWELERIVEG